jgi:tetratricopeptide (TPR) repeat protein
LGYKVTVLVAAFAAISLGQSLEEGIEQLHAAKNTEAASTFRSVLEQDPTSGRARYYLIQALIDDKKIDEAAKVLADIPNECKDTDYLELARAWVDVNSKDYEGARKSLEKALDMNADNPELPYVRGVLELTQKNYSAAAADLERAVEVTPTNANAHYYAGLAYNGLKKPDKMVNQFQTFLKLAPDSPNAAKVRSLLRAVR